VKGILLDWSFYNEEFINERMKIVDVNAALNISYQDFGSSQKLSMIPQLFCEAFSYFTVGKS